YEEIDNLAAGCAGLLSMLGNRLDEAFIERHAGTLRVISNYAVGYNNIDLGAAKKRGIVVTNTPGVLTESTADLAWALIMAVARRIVESDSYTRAGNFEGWAPELFLGGDVHGKVLAIVGLGRIGQAVARRAAGFGMQIIYYNRTCKPETENELGCRKVELDALMAEADFISLHVPLTGETRHLIDERRLGLMKRSAYLINTARGPVVDEHALVRALKAGRIAGAGLDVYEEEPRLHPELQGLPNTVLAPHIGSGTTATRKRMAQIAVDNITAVLRGEKPAHPVPLPS
ncbi:MAG: D-glycerate dehydrogenase, partial [Gemmatimonadota bacterium]|nr:D-glycerate dehydrogenase [Gemmatimonadota bacterium]